jgi:hypothetical protein
MTSTLEQRLAARLHDVGALTPADVDPPLDLDDRVARRKRQHRSRRGYAFVGLAAAVVVAVGTAAVLVRSPTTRSVEVHSPTVDPLPSGTVMLDARQSFVVAIDANAHQLATLVHAGRGTVIDAQLTGDHRSLWYLSVAGAAGKECGEVVRADMMSGTSEIVARAVSFAISPDGRRLALAGAGDTGRGSCVPLTGSSTRARVTVIDRRDGSSATWVDEATPRAYAFNQMRWSPDGRNVVTRVCGETCEALVRFEVPSELDGVLRSHVVAKSGFLGVRPPAAFGPDGALYFLERNVTERWREHAQQLVVYDGQEFTRLATLLSIDFHWDLKEVIPTQVGVFVVGTPRDERGHKTGNTGLYRVVDGGLVHVKDFDFGVMSPTFPLR